MTKRSRRHKWDIDECPVLEDHSKAKHEILSEYIQKYLIIVCQPIQVRQYKITLVDGFSGGGIYDEGKKGSPLVMMDTVEQASDKINQSRIRPVEIIPNYFFIEKNGKTMNHYKV